MVLTRLGLYPEKDNDPGTQACSQQAFYKIIKSLTPDRRAFIIAADLGHLLHIHPVNIRRHMCRWLANTYDVNAKAFILKDGKPCRITLQDVENLMGLPSQGREFHPIGPERTSTLYYELKDNFKSGITYSSLLERMSNKELPLEEFFAVLRVIYYRENIMPYYRYNCKREVLELGRFCAKGEIN